MNHEQAFLRAVRENPDDDAPRLLYADWLEEQRDCARAEFIRVQCRLARMADDDLRRPELTAREQELLLRHGETWVGTVRPLLTGWRFRRGFVETAVVPVWFYLAHGDAPFRETTIRRVEVDLEGTEIPREPLAFIPASVARENRIFPLGRRGDALVLAMQETSDPGALDILLKLNFILNRDIEPVAASAEQLDRTIDRHYAPFEAQSRARENPGDSGGR